MDNDGQPPVNGLHFLYALLPFFVRRFLYAVSNASIIGVRPTKSWPAWAWFSRGRRV